MLIFIRTTCLVYEKNAETYDVVVIPPDDKA
jgi:hypothetical protein